jgi:AbrB family looped-hinge helix DNA binding protein
MYSSTISSKGQITVPLKIRQRLGLKEGDRVEFVIDEDRTVIRPVQPPENPFEQFVGVLPGFKTKREINKWVASLRGNDEDGD